MKLLYCLLVLLMSFTVNIYAKPAQTVAEQSTGTTSNPAELMNNQVDPTDAPAIPVDLSEEELEEEIESLEETEKAYKEKHHN